MCHNAPVPRRRLSLGGAALLLAASLAWAQSEALTPRTLLPDWRRVGSSSYDIFLASAATGPVEKVWFSSNGSRLFIRTASGRFFGTSDFESWQPESELELPAGPSATSVSSTPEPGARVRAADGFYARLYAFGRNVYRSDDGGRSWANRTSLRGQSIIGNGINDLTVSPEDPDVVVAVNGFGVWRSLDGGLSWCGLNDTLPNLPVRRLLAAPSGASGTRLQLAGGTELEWEPGEKQAWKPVDGTAAANVELGRFEISFQLGEEITAFASAGDAVYAGAADGALWVSRDRGRTWRKSRLGGGGGVNSVSASATQAGLAFAVLADPGGDGLHPRVLRTSDSGASWEDLTGDLPRGSAWGIAADPSGDAVYVATDGGVFLSLGGRSGTRLGDQWISMSENLPQLSVRDVRLDDAGNQIYIALDGYGVYAAPAPHRFWNVQVANAADFSQRPAAPGSLLTVLGGRLLRAQAGLLPAPILFSSDTQSQLQIPFESDGSSTLLALQLSQGRFTFSVPLQDVSPAIFVDRDGSAMLMDGDSGVILDASTPAHAGIRLQILATGLGRVNPVWRTGLAAPLQGPPRVVAPVYAYLDGAPLEVTRATLAPGYIGFYVVEVRLPAIVDVGASELYIEAGGHESNKVRIHLEP